MPPTKLLALTDFPTSFFKEFWPDLSETYMNFLDTVIESGEMSVSQRQSIIRLIPKKDKDTTYLKNWRPLTLSQSDSKMLSKTLAIMLLFVISNLIHPNQVAYIANRFIGEGIKTIEGVVEYIQEMGLSAIMFAIDFERAFDSLEWFFIWLALTAYGFPKKFIDKIKILYTNIEACVINGGTSTKYFKISRGIKQGDPASGIIFVLAIELLAIKVRSTKAIQGVSIGETEIKLSGYADDFNHFLRDIVSMKKILEVLERFGIISGLKCNISKCEAMVLGKGKPEDVKYNGESIRWVDKMKITGITFGNDRVHNMNENFKPAIEKVKTNFNMYE